MNTKKLSQVEFDRYMILTLIPEMEEEIGLPFCIVLTGKGKFQFAKECEECHELKIMGKEYDISKEILKAGEDNVATYLETLTGIDVVRFEDITECECLDDDIEIEAEEDEDPDEYYEDSYAESLENEEDLYDDYDEY